ncbi:unnamed protein product, partial [Didymodactylos carnosus]
MLCGVRCTLM